MTDQKNAAQAAEQDPLSDEYVNAVIRQHGYDSHEAVIARLWQWIGLNGGENSVTLLMYEAHEALSKLRAEGVQAGAQMLPSDGLDALRDFKLTVIQDGFHKIGKPMIQQLAQAGALESLGFGKHRVTEYGEWLLSSSSAALASAPVAGEAQKPMVWLLETTPDGYALHRSFDFNEPPRGFPGLVRKTPLYAAPQASQAVRILFPTHLRKMWSGGEVQAWLDNHQGITPPTASAKGSLERYRDWRAEQAEADKDGVRSEGHQ
ncbi:hypothetical protein DVB37_16435 [Achromobacter sp. B7]|uniref:hypothetical protein n=1 Tax=Achromobacter sp. B7 TaxID=2282475 RepID=UPI000E75A311|nr:hypothetical protein [Achromobacter sp. B7]AYD65330.1 hypothetical protein DVB37_16435 [Achromobacter sp. B7]